MGLVLVVLALVAQVLAVAPMGLVPEQALG